MPWVVRLCLAGLTNHDRATEEAAASLGARRWRVIWRVTLPAMRPGIIAAALFAFIVSFDNLEMTMFLVGPGMTTLPIAVLQYLQYHIDPLVAAVAVVQMVLIGGALLLLDRFVRLGAGGAVTRCPRGSRGLTKRYGAARRRRRHHARRGAGRDGRAARAVGLRQDHDAAHDRRASSSRAAATSCSTAQHLRACRRTGARWASCSRATRCSRT